MIRKAVIVVLTLGAIMAGILGVVGNVQGFLDPGRFYDASDHPALHWLQGQFGLGSRLQVMVNSYQAGSLAVQYSSLPTRGWYSRTDPFFRLPGFCAYQVRRCPISLSSRNGPPAGTVYQQAGWIIIIPFLLIAFLIGLYPLMTFLRGPLRRWRRRKRGECIHCGYNLTGNVTGVCSECGTKIESP